MTLKIFNQTFINSILILAVIHLNYSQEFSNSDEGRYLDVFDKMASESYSAPLSTDLKTKCKSQGIVKDPKNVSISSSMTSDVLQKLCGTSSICTIPSGLTVKMTTSLNVAALVVYGTLEWSDSSQIADVQFICAGYVAV